MTQTITVQRIMVKHTGCELLWVGTERSFKSFWTVSFGKRTRGTGYGRKNRVGTKDTYF